MIDLDLIAYRDKLRTRPNEAGQTEIYDTVRKKWLVLLPEEMVRQLFIHYCISKNLCPPSRISIERQITINNISRRYDIVLFNSKGNPEILVECKAPSVVLDAAVFEQIAHYNMALRVPYLIVTNGMHTHAFVIDFERNDFNPVSEMPAVT